MESNITMGYVEKIFNNPYIDRESGERILKCIAEKGNLEISAIYLPTMNKWIHTTTEQSPIHRDKTPPFIDLNEIYIDYHSLNEQEISHYHTHPQSFEEFLLKNRTAGLDEVNDSENFRYNRNYCAARTCLPSLNDIRYFTYMAKKYKIYAEFDFNVVSAYGIVKIKFTEGYVEEKYDMSTKYNSIIDEINEEFQKLTAKNAISALIEHLNNSLKDKCMIEMSFWDDKIANTRPADRSIIA